MLDFEGTGADQLTEVEPVANVPAQELFLAFSNVEREQVEDPIVHQKLFLEAHNIILLWSNVFDNFISVLDLHNQYYSTQYNYQQNKAVMKLAESKPWELALLEVDLCCFGSYVLHLDEGSLVKDGFRAATENILSGHMFCNR